MDVVGIFWKLHFPKAKIIRILSSRKSWLVQERRKEVLPKKLTAEPQQKNLG